MPTGPLPIQVAPMHAAMPTGSSETWPVASPCVKVTRSATPSSTARVRAVAMETVLMSTPVPVIWWSRAQVQSISPVPQARSSMRVPAGGLSASPRVASFSLVNGLWMRWLLSRMV